MKPAETPPISPDLGLLLGGLLLLVVVVTLAFVTRPLIPLDETRYVGVAWEMWTRGEFLVPFKNGEPYSDKPPLLFWLIHAGWTLFGVSEWWPRFVSPLFTAASLVLTWQLGRALWPGEGGISGRAAMVLMTSLMWMLFSTALMFDVLLTFWVLLGMLGILDARDGNARGFVLLGVALGAGILAKGPVVLLHLLPVALLAPWWHLPVRRARWLAGVALAVAIAAVIALAWALPAGARGGEAYRQAIFWGQTADRMVESFAHQRPAWWYLPLLPGLLFPWFVWPQLWRVLALEVRRGLDPGMRFCLAWMLPVFVAFSLVSGKQPHYLIPLFPAFALLAARVLRAREATGSLLLPAGVTVLTGFALAMAAAGHLAWARDEGLHAPPLWIGVVLMLLGIAIAFVSPKRATPFARVALLGAVTFTLTHLAVMRMIVPRYDLEPLARAIHAVQASGAPVANVANYHAQYQFLGRLEQPLVELSAEEVGRWSHAHPKGYAVIYVKETGRWLEAVEPLHMQPYRGGMAVLVAASDVAALRAPWGPHR